jgi:hypothetical protein
MYPPGPPTEVVAVAGDETVAVSWIAPSYAGSSPITAYRVTGSPGGTCTTDVTVTTCEITGLINDDTYHFAVQAANSIGWGNYSLISNSVVPKPPPPPPPPPVEPTIVISGSRGEVRGKRGIIVTGETTGFAAGDILIPWFRWSGPSEYSPGFARISIREDGDFRWQRRTGRKIYIIIRSEADPAIRSNRLILPAP